MNVNVLNNLRSKEIIRISMIFCKSRIDLLLSLTIKCVSLSKFLISQIRRWSKLSTSRCLREKYASIESRQERMITKFS